MRNMRPLRVGFLAALVAMLLAADVGVAQTAAGTRGVAVVNETEEPLKVYAFGQNEEQRVLLGWVGGTELEYFQVPDQARTDDGSYRIGVQAILPEPQLGVSARPFPLEVTGTLTPSEVETVRLVITQEGEELELSYDMVR